MFQHLAAAGVAVFAYDAAGLGASEPKEGADRAFINSYQDMVRTPARVIGNVTSWVTRSLADQSASSPPHQLAWYYSSCCADILEAEHSLHLLATLNKTRHHLLPSLLGPKHPVRQVEDFLAFTRHVSTAYAHQLSGCPLFAAGYSIGAQYAALAAVQAPALFAGVALVSPAAGLHMDMWSR